MSHVLEAVVILVLGLQFYLDRRIGWSSKQVHLRFRLRAFKPFFESSPLESVEIMIVCLNVGLKWLYVGVSQHTTRRLSCPATSQISRHLATSAMSREGDTWSSAAHGVGVWGRHHGQ